MPEYDIIYKSDIISGDAIIEPEGACSISFENLGTKTAYIFDLIPVVPAKIRELNNEAGCHITQKIRISYRGHYLISDSVEVNTNQILVTKTFATLKNK